MLLTLYDPSERIRPVFSGLTCHLYELYLQGNRGQLDPNGRIWTPDLKG